ncbi:imelysin family protein [Rhodobacter calidifons]|uniref:Peptidase n=1 Tax=Rhodobacter calidifons TaxID=2715277 RepID=A0ABX0G5C8_9RHOB|nr:imelysin family protein [Rhodobacter calidifons]NHB76419.1 peptidase [Rhodobacter calidifons]
MRLLTAFALSTGLASAALAATPAEVTQTYADIALAAYQDSLTTAKALQAAVAALIASPSEATLQAARQAWLAARVPYQQTEAFRFGNPIVDDWEGRVNAWPLDEGLIDYVAGDYGNEENALARLNVIATPKFTLSGIEIDATQITPALIRDTLHEADGIEANVASGYHAIEFLLWGQDLNGTGPGAGARPYTDYLQGEGCTGGNCDRRAAYLQAATDLLVADLQEMVGNWQEGGPARAAVTRDPQAGLLAMLTGMGSLSYGELAGERMKLGLMLNDPEEEHDCFSDNTHNSHYFDGVGIRNVYLGRYLRLDGSVVEGFALADLVAAADPAVDAQLKAELEASVAALGAVKAAADGGLAYDQMLAPGNAQGEELIMAAVNALVTQTASIERAVTALGLSKVTFEGSDSLDNPNAVFQ